MLTRDIQGVPCGSHANSVENTCQNSVEWMIYQDRTRPQHGGSTNKFKHTRAQKRKRVGFRGWNEGKTATADDTTIQNVDDVARHSRGRISKSSKDGGAVAYLEV